MNLSSKKESIDTGAINSSIVGSINDFIIFELCITEIASFSLFF